MKKKQFLCLITACALLSGCAQIEQEELSPETVLTATGTTALQSESAADSTIPKRETVALQVPEITRQDAKINIEAEDAAIPEQCAVAVMPRLGYSGTGYLSGLNAENKVKLSLQAEIPATQHYDITFVVGSVAPSTCKILANDEPVYTLQTEPTDNFVRITVQGVFLNSGSCTFSIEPIEGSIDVDCLELTNNESLYEESAVVADAPVDPSASAGAKKLYTYLKDAYGSKIATGQYVSDNTGKEIGEIYSITGEYPMIRFADLGAYSPNGGDQTKATAIADSLAWAEEGGAVGLSWYWNAPTGTPSVYAKDTTFDLAKAVTEEDVASLSLEALQKKQQAGEISEECCALIQDIDALSADMQPLADADVPVLWRPLMEASGEWYWWGASGADAYRWLWNLMYTRMTSYHNLHNLIWVWNGQSNAFQVDADKYDIAALDLYVEKEEVYGSRYEQYVALRNMVPGKMLAISECSNIPDITAMFRDNAVWSFFGLWYAPYLGEYTDNQALVDFYHSEGTLTRNDYAAALQG